MKPVAFLILAHTDPQACSRLIGRLLLDTTAIIFVHVDKKTQVSFAAVQKLDPLRVHLISNRSSISWSGYSMVRATLNAMKEALEKNADWEYLVLLSGLDYPIKSPQQIKEYLYGQPFRQHINRINVADSPEHYLKMVRAYNFRDTFLPFNKLDKGFRKIISLAARPLKRKLLPGTICTGSSWWALTRDFAEYTVNFTEKHPEYEQFFRFTYAADEYFFQTLLQNSPFANEAAPIAVYCGRGMWKTANFHIIHPSLRKIYCEEDFDEVMQSDKCFVRKVTTQLSTPLLDRIDATLDNPSA